MVGGRIQPTIAVGNALLIGTILTADDFDRLDAMPCQIVSKWPGIPEPRRGNNKGQELVEECGGSRNREG
jgi:hypothetical protein